MQARHLQEFSAHALKHLSIDRVYAGVDDIHVCPPHAKPVPRQEGLLDCRQSTPSIRATDRTQSGLLHAPRWWRVLSRAVMPYRALTMRSRSALVEDTVLLQAVDPCRRMANQICGIFQIELGLDIRTVGFDRLDANVQPGRDRRGAHSTSNGFEHLELAIRQVFELALMNRPFAP